MPLTDAARALMLEVKTRRGVSKFDLPSSGQISASDINVELGRAFNAEFNIGGSEERALAGVSSGEISFSDFYGATLGYELTIETKDDIIGYSAFNIAGSLSPVTININGDDVSMTRLAADLADNDTIITITPVSNYTGTSLRIINSAGQFDLPWSAGSFNLNNATLKNWFTANNNTTQTIEIIVV